METQAAARIVGPRDHLGSPRAYQAYLEHHAQRPGNKEAFGFRAYYMDHWDVPEGARILDLGCYVGATAIHYAELGHEVVGVDGSQTYVNQARANAIRRECNVFKLVFTSELFEEYETSRLFDACCCTEVLQFVMDPALVVAKAYECLRAGGTFFCTVPAKSRGTAVREISQAELGTLLTDAGFEIKQLFRPAPVPKDGVPQIVAEGIK